MSQTRQFCAKPYFDSAPSTRTKEALAVDAILLGLSQLEAPFVTPAHIASKLGLTPNAMRYHCRNCRNLRNWTGSYRFFMDDEGHVAVLRVLVSLAVHSVKSLPAGFSTKVH